MRYKIVSKIIENIEIVGYVVEDDSGNKHSVSKTDTVKLINANKIDNAEAVLNPLNGEYIINVHGGIESIPKFSKASDTDLRIIGRILDTDDKCIGYKAQDSNGKIYKISVNKAWELGVLGHIKDIQCKIIGEQKIIKSTSDCKLIEIPVSK